MMKKKILSLAVTAGLVGAVFTAQAQEMHVNDRGLGEALIYPFYSAANGNDTYIHLVNTTSATKAVKVRFIEGMNSQEVLDFNLYLSPEDVWAAVITPTGNGGAMVRTVDTSCTVPMLGTQGGGQVVTEGGVTRRDQPFVNIRYQSDAADFRGLDRTLEGYVEIIEMGQIVSDGTAPNLEAAILHDNNGKPAGCDLLVKAWSTGGAWRADASHDFTTWDGGEDAQGLAGGLYGFGVVINVEDGTASSYDAVAIDDFVIAGSPDLHFAPGNELPNLGNGQNGIAIFDGTQVITDGMADSFDAVSTLLQSSYLMNDYVIDPAINATTDWVVTMPTKRNYVNVTPTASTSVNPGSYIDQARPPFKDGWDPRIAEACEPVGFQVWNREEHFEQIIDGPVFSPAPETQTTDNVLCSEVNVITFGGENAGSTLKVSENIQTRVDPGYNEGWARLSFLPADVNAILAGKRVIQGYNNSYAGLPVTGFASFGYQNGTLGGGAVLSNYGADSVHKTEISVTASSTAPQ